MLKINFLNIILLVYFGATIEKTIHFIPYIPLESYLEKCSFESKISLQY